MRSPLRALPAFLDYLGFDDKLDRSSAFGGSVRASSEAIRERLGPDSHDVDRFSPASAIGTVSAA